jgi:hypothetical protein
MVALVALVRQLVDQVEPVALELLALRHQ